MIDDAGVLELPHEVGFFVGSVPTVGHDSNETIIIAFILDSTGFNREEPSINCNLPVPSIILECKVISILMTTILNWKEVSRVVNVNCFALIGSCGNLLCSLT